MNIFGKSIFFKFSLVAVAAFLFFVCAPNAHAATEVTEDISVDTTWNISGSPYIISFNSIKVSEGVTLTIDPGVVVKLDSSFLFIYGDLIANGEIGNEIHLTSYFDDSIGGDSNGDYFCDLNLGDEGNLLPDTCGSLFEPKENDWGAVIFVNSHNNSLKNIVVEYASYAFSFDSSYANLKNIEILDVSKGFYVTSSNVDADNVNITNVSDVAMYDDLSSQVNWINSKIDTVSGSAIITFSDGNLNLSNFSIKNIIGGQAIYLFKESNLTADGLKIEDVSGFYGISVYNDSHFIIKNSSAKNCGQEACLTFYDQDQYLADPSVIDIEDSVFDGGGKYAIFTYGKSDTQATIKNSTFKNFTDYGIRNLSRQVINAKNNWWGDKSGPYHGTLNPEGGGSAVSDNVEFEPWCTNGICRTHNPVILIPGIMGTQLFKNYGDNSEIWPNTNELLTSISDSFLDDLTLDANGEENDSKPISLGDIIRGIKINILGIPYESHTFDGLIETLTQNGYVEGQDLFVFPYDWRKSNKTSGEKLKEKIEQILGQTGSGEVDLVAHSMGGLVAKSYIAQNSGDKIGNLIFIGTPHLGAPKAFKALMYGDDMGINIVDSAPFRLLNPAKVKYISQNMPGVYELLPSKKYVDGQEDFIGQKYFVSENGYSYDETKGFLSDQNKNKNILAESEELHDDLDNLNLGDIKVTNFSGCGKTKTVGKIIKTKKKSWKSLYLKEEEGFQVDYVNGDDTVPLHSSVDSKGDKYYVQSYSHSELPSAPGLKEDVLAILDGKAVSDFDNISKDIDTCYIPGKVVSTHSPVELHIYDESGNYAGPSQDGNIENNLPGVTYDTFDEENFAFLPDGTDYKIEIKATDIGGFNFQIKDEDKNDEITDSFDWTLVPLESLQSKGEIWVGPDHPAENYQIKMDQNGDGNIDETLPASFNGTSEAERTVSPVVPSPSGGRFILNVLNNKKDVPEPLPETAINEIVPIPGEKTELSPQKINKNILAKLVKNETLKEPEENIPLSASANKAGFKINEVWLLVIAGGFILGILAKRFIKR